MSRFDEQLRTIPPVTVGIIGICTILYIIQVLFDIPLNNLTMCPRIVLYLHEYYRVVTSALFHGSMMHIGMNMMSTSAISTMLEKRLGTLRLLLTTLWSILLTSILYMTIAFAFSLVLQNDGLMYQHSIGFSGVIFHFLVLESNLGPHGTRSIFGFLSVPSYLYPWALLIILQFIMPNLSFVGHLSGILVGMLQIYGLLTCAFPSENFLREMDGWTSLRWLSRRPSFVPTTANDITIPIQGGLLQSVGRGGQFFFSFICNILETLKVIIFGRGERANANIHVNNRWNSRLLSGSSPDNVETTDQMDGDEEWAGLPPELPSQRQSEMV